MTWGLRGYRQWTHKLVEEPYHVTHGSKTNAQLPLNKTKEMGPVLVVLLEGLGRTFKDTLITITVRL